MGSSACANFGTVSEKQMAQIVLLGLSLASSKKENCSDSLWNTYFCTNEILNMAISPSLNSVENFVFAFFFPMNTSLSYTETVVENPRNKYKENKFSVTQRHQH